jgi:hypothetical protein
VATWVYKQCWHVDLPVKPVFAADVIAALRRWRDASLKPVTAENWQDRRYTVACPGIAPHPFPVDVHGGRGLGPPDSNNPGGYDIYVAPPKIADLTADGRPEATVLVGCGPHPSNFGANEVQIFTAGPTGPKFLARLLPPPVAGASTATWQPLFDTITIKAGQLMTSLIYCRKAQAADRPKRAGLR